MIERMEHYRNAFEAYLQTTFAENVPQFDDMTMLCLSYNGGNDGGMI